MKHQFVLYNMILDIIYTTTLLHSIIIFFIRNGVREYIPLERVRYKIPTIKIPQQVKIPTIRHQIFIVLVYKYKNNSLHFEQASINVSCSEIPEIRNTVCFFYLSQSAWRKVQKLGLITYYGTNEEFSLKIRQMLALAFLLPEDKPSVFDELKLEIPQEA